MDTNIHNCMVPDECLNFVYRTEFLLNAFESFVTFSRVEKAEIVDEKSGLPATDTTTKEVVKLRYRNGRFNTTATLEIGPRLMRAFYIGRRINTMRHIYPCFFTTYGWYAVETSTDEAIETIRREKRVPDDMFQLITPVPVKRTDLDFRELGVNTDLCGKTQALLVESANGAIPLSDIINEDSAYRDIFRTDIFSVLFQIFTGLSSFEDAYAHMDIGTDNVVLVEPMRGACIEYSYRIWDESGRKRIVSFVSKYLVKIRNYGMRYFDDRKIFDCDADSSAKISKSYDYDYERLCGTNSKLARSADSAVFATSKHQKLFQKIMQLETVVQIFHVLARALSCEEQKKINADTYENVPRVARLSVDLCDGLPMKFIILNPPMPLPTRPSTPSSYVTVRKNGKRKSMTCTVS